MYVTSAHAHVKVHWIELHNFNAHYRKQILKNRK